LDWRALEVENTPPKENWKIKESDEKVKIILKKPFVRVKDLKLLICLGSAKSSKGCLFTI